MEACLPKDDAGNFIADQEKSDVVHDLLAYQTERMLELNKQKQQEINGFLGRLGPLRERIRQTDELIDQVVCRLYGLTARRWRRSTGPRVEPRGASHKIISTDFIQISTKPAIPKSWFQRASQDCARPGQPTALLGGHIST